MKKRSFVVFLASALVCTAVPQVNPISTDMIVAEAHSGRTDSSGGHKDNKNKSGLGSYHYHCGGYSAHLHENGVCPYSSAAPTTTSSSTSSVSSTDDTIKQVQQALNDKGYDCGVADGVMGEKTKNAVEQFQKDHELTVDGIIGKQVKDALGIA